jgi:RNA recognition motif-containing protein
MSKRLFVGGLPYSITSSQLEEMFSKIGTVVSAIVITDRDTGQSKGFGFVEMEKDEEADKAIEKLNETEMDGRKIAVNIAKPREERPRFDSRGGGPRRDDRRPQRGGRR